MKLPVPGSESVLFEMSSRLTFGRRCDWAFKWATARRAAKSAGAPPVCVLLLGRLVLPKKPRRSVRDFCSASTEVAMTVGLAPPSAADRDSLNPFGLGRLCRDDTAAAAGRGNEGACANASEVAADAAAADKEESGAADVDAEDADVTVVVAAAAAATVSVAAVHTASRVESSTRTRPGRRQLPMPLPLPLPTRGCSRGGSDASVSASAVSTGRGCGRSCSARVDAGPTAAHTDADDAAAAVCASDSPKLHARLRVQLYALLRRGAGACACACARAGVIVVMLPRATNAGRRGEKKKGWEWQPSAGWSRRASRLCGVSASLCVRVDDGWLVCVCVSVK